MLPTFPEDFPFQLAQSHLRDQQIRCLFDLYSRGGRCMELAWYKHKDENSKFFGYSLMVIEFTFSGFLEFMSDEKSRFELIGDIVQPPFPIGDDCLIIVRAQKFIPSDLSVLYSVRRGSLIFRLNFAILDEDGTVDALHETAEVVRTLLHAYRNYQIRT